MLNFNKPLLICFIMGNTLTSPIAAQHSTQPAVQTLPSVYRLTLEEAKERALANNQQLQLGRMNLAEKQLGVSAAKRDYLPKILGSAAFIHFNDDLGTVVATRS